MLSSLLTKQRYQRHQELVVKQASYQDSLLIIDRLWKQVTGDIQALAERANGDAVPDAEPDHSLKREQIDGKDVVNISAKLSRRQI